MADDRNEHRPQGRDFGEELPRREPGHEDRGGLRLVVLLAALAAVAAVLLFGLP